MILTKIVYESFLGIKRGFSFVTSIVLLIVFQIKIEKFKNQKQKNFVSLFGFKKEKRKIHIFSFFYCINYIRIKFLFNYII